MKREKVKVEILKKEPHIHCESCGKKRNKHVAFINFHIPMGAIYICLKCLQDLRNQIDAFRILVITGENTK